MSNISKVAIIGFGTMGAGIAQRFAECGYDVVATDVTKTQIDSGLARIKRNQQTLTELGLLDAEEAKQTEQGLTTTLSLEDTVHQAQLVIEALPEDITLKLDLFAKLDKLCPPQTCLASNTSGLSITKIASSTTRRDRVAGYHWWNPPHVIPLVEVTKGEKTSDETVSLLVEIAKSLGKKPIVVNRDIPGFVGNRLQFAVFREALHILSEGVASAEDIDTAMSAGPGLRYGLLGPFRTADLGGLDVFHAVSTYLFKELSTADKPDPLLSEMVKQGRLGAKTGHGFYEFAGQSIPDISAQRDQILLGFLKVLKRKSNSS